VFNPFGKKTNNNKGSFENSGFTEPKAGAMSQNLNNSGLGTLSSGGGNSFTTKEVNLSKPIKEEPKP